MKTQNKILLLFTFMLVVLSANSQIFKGKAQKEKPVRYNVVEGDKYRGWIFIDGKYIDAPYKVKRKGTAIYINGIQVSKELEQEKDPFAINGRVGYPPNLTDSSSLDDLLNTINEYLGISYHSANYNYFFKKYTYKIAWDSVINYMRNAPNIDSVQCNKINKGLVVKCKNGEIGEFMGITSSMANRSYKWGPNGSGTIPKKELEKTEKEWVEELNSQLEQKNGIIFCFTNYNNNGYILSNYGFEQCSPMIYNITIEETTDEIKMYLLKEPYIKTFIENVQNSNQFYKRYELLKTYIENKNKKTVGLFNNKREKISIVDSSVSIEKSFSVYSTPYKNSFYAWFGNAWEYGEAIIEDELTTVRNNIINQGFNKPIIFKDLTAIPNYRAGLTRREQYGNGYTNVNFSIGVRYTLNRQQK